MTDNQTREDCLISPNSEADNESAVSSAENQAEFIHINNSVIPPHANSSRRVNMSAQLSNMFGQVTERYVIFCIDTSGSMFRALDVVKEHLMETLSSLAAQDNAPMFNLIEFNSQVTQWSDKLVQCTPETIAVAREWVNTLAAKTGTNTQDALLTALADPDCQAVYLVTGSIPDQYTEEVLDKILGICGKCQLHCIYIAGEIADEAVVEFLEDLAVETFGSLRIATLNSQGSVERVKLVYCSDHAREKLVWTLNNTLRPNVKTCSVSTTLQLDPDEILCLLPQSRALPYDPNFFTQSSVVLNTWPYRYYYPYYWSRYHPAKAWQKTQDRLVSSLSALSPVAGSLLLGKKVIARRLEDGYFYRATIQSQNFGKSFLVAFGPCKHGKYNQTEYQDVFVFDIVDYTDALRHAILTGDRVLAPWEPEGERFAPGIVIDGQENRQADGLDSYHLTVAFSNGKTEKISRDVAVWIPPAMYDRLSLELQMSASARKILFSTVENYPIENFPGYPTMNYPAEYFRPDPFVLESNPYIWDPAQFVHFPYLSALYGYPPFVIKQKTDEEKHNKTPPVGVFSEDSALIPNTEMTKKELEDRIMTQIMEHRCRSKDGSEMKTDVGKESADPKSIKLLRRRVKQEENHLNRHVHFEEKEKAKEQEATENKSFDDSDYDTYGNPVKNTDCAVSTDSSLLFYSSPGVGHRPAWRKFWRNDPSPPCSAISEDYRRGFKRATGTKPFKETAVQAPLESRDQRTPPYNVEWASSAFKYVDTFAKHDYSNNVKQCLSAYKPPAKEDVGPISHSYTVGSQPTVIMSAEEKEEARIAYRRRGVLKRETEWQGKLQEEDNVKALMQDHHRERILSQLERDRQRHIQEHWDIQQAREAKKKISAELRARIEANQKEEAEKDTRRIAALTKRRERREMIKLQQEEEIQECLKRREQIRKQNNEARLSAHIERLDEEEAEAMKQEKQHQRAKLQRLHHFRTLEKEAQKKKDLRTAVKEQQQALTRSYIFS